VVILCTSSTITVSKTLEQCEQVIVCPSSLKSNEIEFAVKGSHTTAYLMKKEPYLLPGRTLTNHTVKQRSVKDGGFLATTFNLVKGSTLSWNITATRCFIFYLVQGEEQFDKFENYEEFHHIWASKKDKNVNYSYSVSSSDEYFAIIDAACGDITVDEHTYSINHSRYDTRNYVSKSSSSCTFDVDKSDMPGACLVADMPCSVTQDIADDVTIKYTLDNGTVFYVCLAFAIIAGVAMVASIVVCIVCMAKKKQGTQGTTYQAVPSSAAQAPAYPAAYQQPQPPAAYNPAAPVYATAGGVDPNAVPPAYNPAAGVDPNAAPPAFNPAYTPSYGTTTTY